MADQPAPARKPHASQVSRVLREAGLTKWEGGKTDGYVVRTERQTQAINHVTGMPDSYRFPIVTVKWEDSTILKAFRRLLMPEEDGLNTAREALTAAGYAVEEVTTDRAIRYLVVIPQELVDWRTERDQRAQKADELAEEMTPQVTAFRVIRRTFPNHHRTVVSHGRAKIVSGVAEMLRDPSFDVMNADAVSAECTAEREKNDGRIFGLRQGGTVYLFVPAGEEIPRSEPAQEAADKGGAVHLITRY